MAGPESSWMKCEPGTVTSVWLFQFRQNSRDRADQDRAGLGVDEQFREVVFAPSSANSRPRSAPRRQVRLQSVSAAARSASASGPRGTGTVCDIPPSPSRSACAIPIPAAPARRTCCGRESSARPCRSGSPGRSASPLDSIRPSEAIGPHDRLHIGDAADSIAVMVGPVEAQRRTPIMHHEHDGRRWPRPRLR